ncbi:MAG: preprotein translocase subunit YajC [Elusimicrobiota bacterium]
MTSLVYAANGTVAAAPMGTSDLLMNFVPLIVIFFIFYFLLIMPQQKKIKEHEKMLNALKKGDRIITNGGLYAMVVNVRGAVVEVKIADGVNVELSRAGIASVIKPEEAKLPEIVQEKK